MPASTGHAGVLVPAVRLVKITRRYDVPIIDDDVYAELVFDGSRPRSLRAFAGPSEESSTISRCAGGSSVRPARCSRRGQRFTNFIRISAGAPWSERIAEGLRTLARLVASE